MAQRYRKRVPKKRKQRSHGGVPQLAAAISGRALSTVYRVMYGEVKSAPVQRAIEEAQRQLRGEAA
jgi:hypothetical protein